MSFIVGIDGPAGTGKGTITNLVAKDLKLNQIDTGAMYRAFTLYMLDNKVELDEIEKIKERKIYIPRMIHPWKGKSFEEFVKKQEHRLEDVS